MPGPTILDEVTDLRQCDISGRSSLQLKSVTIVSASCRLHVLNGLDALVTEFTKSTNGADSFGCYI